MGTGQGHGNADTVPAVLQSLYILVRNCRPVLQDMLLRADWQKFTATLRQKSTHGVTYQKTAMFKVTATRTSNMANLKAPPTQREMPYSAEFGLGTVQDTTVGYNARVYTQMCITPQRNSPLNWPKVIITTYQNIGLQTRTTKRLLVPTAHIS